MSSGTPSTAYRKVQALKPQSIGIGATVAGTGFDTRGFEWADVVLETGVVTATGTLAVKVQECATLGGTYTDITGAAFATVTDALDDLPYSGEIDLRGPRLRFMKVTVTNATAAGLMSCLVILSRARETTRVHAAQGASEAPATPLTTTAAFSV